jgi:transposase
MRRHVLSDQQWVAIEKLLPRGPGRPSTAGDRNFIDAVLWIAKTGAPWRDLPEQFGSWKTIYNRFHRWANRDVWREIFRAAAESEEELAGILDSSVVRAHQDAAGGKGGPKKTTSAVRGADFRRRSTPQSTFWAVHARS